MSLFWRERFGEQVIVCKPTVAYSFMNMQNSDAVNCCYVARLPSMNNWIPKAAINRVAVLFKCVRCGSLPRRVTDLQK